jgi:lysophospholipase L1-like esterase
LSYYGDLIHKIKSKTDAKIIFTSLLPHLVDFKLSERKLNNINSELRRLCNRRSLLFCNLYRSFLHNNKPDPSFYAPRDGLHLNFSGTVIQKENYLYYQTSQFIDRFKFY